MAKARGLDELRLERRSSAGLDRQQEIRWPQHRYPGEPFDGACRSQQSFVSGDEMRRPARRGFGDNPQITALDCRRLHSTLDMTSPTDYEQANTH